MRDLISNFAFFQALMPQELIATDLTGVTIDTQGYEGVTFVVNVGHLSLITSTSYAQLVIQHTDGTVADDAVASDFAIVSDAKHLVGLVSTISALTSGIWKIIGSTGATAANTASFGSNVHAVGYIGPRRFVRLYIDAVGTVNNVSDGVGAIAMLGLPGDWPAVSEVALHATGT